jgi:Tfp pilus assembly protein PilX
MMPIEKQVRQINMKTLENKEMTTTKMRNNQNQRGSAIVIALLVLILVGVFVALALSRTSSETVALGNESAEGRTFYAAQGSLEMMTRNFNKVFEVKVSPADTDLDAVRNGVEPRLTPQFAFVREVDKTSDSLPAILTDKSYAGLYAVRDYWRLRTTATDQNSGVQIQLTRNILNNRIPIFQFGIFYNDDLELSRPPRFSFGGRVHSNRHFFISPGSEGVYFNSQVTAVGHVITQTWSNGNQSDKNNNQTFIKNASAQDKQLLPAEGSVLNTTAGAADNVFASNPDLPPSRLNSSWLTQSAIFDGNLKSGVPKLKLPLNVGKDTDLAEMVRRGKRIPDTNGGDLWQNNAGNVVPVAAGEDDASILKAERFANKTGIRVSLADSKAKLPGCASGTGITPISAACGVMLDGHKDGVTDDPKTFAEATAAFDLSLATRGYQPKPMKMTSGAATFDYKATRVNGERLYTGNLVTGRRVWIKVETVKTNTTTGAIETKDITQDFLSLGVTEQVPSAYVTMAGPYDQTAPDNLADATTRNLNKVAAQLPSEGTDSRSIIKLQRFVIPGPAIPGGSNLLKSFSTPNPYNLVVRYGNATATNIIAGCVAGCVAENLDPTSGNEKYGHLKQATVNGVADKAIVPFPIQMFDTREGTYYNDVARYTAGRVTRNGVMSMVDIDVANLRRFLRGDFNGLFPTDTPFAVSNSNVGLVNSDIPQKEGWVLYVSDRRGDEDFDGEYDMEDIYGNSPGNDGNLQTGEDLDFPGTPGFGVLNTSYTNEAVRYADDWLPDFAAVNDHKYYRRGVRLINGTVVPGVFDAVTPANNRGFTLASENGVYVYGNYNATGVTSVPATGNTPYENYRPFGKPAMGATAAVLAPTHIAASIVADSVTILSNSKYFASGASLPDYTNGWNDAKSFASPYDANNRRATETTIRFAMISGDTISSILSNPNQSGLYPKMNGGVHNFKRFLERWTDPATGATFKVNLNYSGSLINLFNSHNNNGSIKCCDIAYNPPIRNWVFDSTFLDPTRLPPGTPFFQYVQTTGFQRTND